MRGEQHRGVAPPQDRALPHLASLLDPRVVEPRLRALLGGHGTFELHLLKLAPAKRGVVAAEFSGGQRAILKLYRKDRARHHAVVLRALTEALHGGTRTPRLLDGWDDLGVLVQEWVPGAGVPEFEALGTEVSLLERLGVALAEFHQAPTTAGPPASLETHLRRACHPGLEALWADLPHLRPSLRALESAARAREARLARSVRPCHGDFSPRQIFVHGALVYLVDVDGMCQGDPALDVANFRVGLHAHLGAPGVARADEFLAAYLERRGLQTLPSLAHYEAFAWMRRAMILWRKRPPGWEEQLRGCLELGHACLGI